MDFFMKKDETRIVTNAIYRQKLRIRNNVITTISKNDRPSLRFVTLSYKK